MPAKVLAVGFDAMEATLVERWAESGRLPTFASLSDAGTLLRVANPVDTLPATVWPEIATGRTGGSIGWYWNRYQVHVGETKLRQTRADDVDLTAVWEHASAAGRQVAVLDVPHSAPTPGLNGVHLREWGNHDTAFGLGGDPQEFLEDVLERHGAYPGPRGDECEEHEDRGDFERLRNGLLAGVEAKRRLFRDVLDDREWDLFFGAFSESHCVSHQFWRFFDETSPWYEPNAPEDFRTAIPDVYARLDAALGHVLEGVDDETLVLVVLSHGMGQSVGGPQVLPEVLVRLGYGSGHGTASGVRSRLPDPVKRALKAAIRGRARRRLQTAAGSLPDPLASPRTRALYVPNGRCGAIRLNVRGRDPMGSIEPGAEYDAACAELAEEITALVNADSGKPAVVSVVRTDSVYDRVHPNIPDLIVRFNQDDGPITTVRSERVGTVAIPIEQHSLQRSGDHTPHSRVWMRGPGVDAGVVRDEGDLLDIAPTVLQHLGVAVPDELRGRPLTAVRSATR